MFIMKSVRNCYITLNTFYEKTKKRSLKIGKISVIFNDLKVKGGQFLVPFLNNKC